MSTWRLLSDERSGYRWEAARDEARGAQVSHPDSVSRLPSMSDLLLQGCPKLVEENCRPSFGSLPMFSTGSGKAVALKQSSIEKALAVLRDDDFLDTGSPKLLERNGRPSFGSSPVFTTGSGKSVTLKQSSIEKALAVLGDNGFHDTGCPKLHEANRRLSNGSFPMFSTGSGKSVSLKESTIAKALAVLGDDDFPDTGQVHLKHHGTRTNSFFQTASGKKVQISSTNLVKGKALLEEATDHCAPLAPKFTGILEEGGEIFRTPISTTLKRKSAEIDVLDRSSVSSNSFAVKALEGKGLGDGNGMEQKVHDIHKKPAPIKFQTAGGKSISISTDALKRARSLLGDPEIGNLLGDFDPNGKDLAFNGKRSSSISSRKENGTPNLNPSGGTPLKKDTSSTFVSPLTVSFSSRMNSLNMSDKIAVGSNLISEFDEAARENDCRSNIDLACVQNPLTDGPCMSGGKPFIRENSSPSNSSIRPSRGPLVDISNRIGGSYFNSEKSINEKKTTCQTNSGSPFKRPRSSKFSTPFKRNSSLLNSGLSTMSVHSPSKGRVSTRYPFLVRRASMKEYFGGPPDVGFPRARDITPGNAEKFVFSDEVGSYCISVEDFFHMLVESGASARHISQRWVSNHYRWIVWKLVHYERCYPAKCAGKFLTVSNVLEELKYRYEREVNHGHRSAIKRILEGDALPSSMIVLRVSSIQVDYEPKIESCSASLKGIPKNNMTKVELTDGWYSVGAIFDDLLLKYCDSGKISAGQKLRIWGARLNGWSGPTSPLEVTDTVNLLVHVNGTYRAHWTDRLGFCKGHAAPLAFKCIKSYGGPVSRTLVGITRIYPILYKERLIDRDSIVRSEKMELKIRQSHSQRCSAIIEGVMSQFRRGNKDFLHLYNDSDSEEGAKISKILETAAEPEVIMAEMSPDQLNAFATYRSRMEAIKQSDTDKLIEKALQDAGLREREVSPFMRLRVVGLQSKTSTVKNGPEGLITIWNPTEMQQHDLVEGSAYAISGLLPTGSSSDTIYLQARGATTKWKPLTSRELENFRPFYIARKAISLSNLGEIPLSSEFDIAGFVLYVGEATAADRQRRQWVFVTDGSRILSNAAEVSNSLLAISFSASNNDDIDLLPFNPNLVGSTVGFFNLIKKAKDQINHLWVADTTENSTYSLKFNASSCSHLKDAAASTRQWANLSGLIIDELKRRILFITGDCGH